MLLIGRIRRKIRNMRIKWSICRKSSIEKAIGWLKEREITQASYLIPTLYDFGDKEYARLLAEREAHNQLVKSSSMKAEKPVRTFDAAGKIRGFLTVLDDMPRLEGSLRQACEFVFSHIASDGNVLSQAHGAWEFSNYSRFSHYANLYVLLPLVEAGKKLREKKYIRIAGKSLDYYRSKQDLLDFNGKSGMFLDTLGFITEALVDLGETELAKTGLKKALNFQRANGFIPAYPGAEWLLSSGLGQLAVVLYKLRQREPADKAVGYMEHIQNSSGGFYGSYGKGAQYFPKEEIAWPVKFYLDAFYWKIKTCFNQEAVIYPESVGEQDGRIKEIVSFFGDLKNKKVIDIGCGKGRFIRALKKLYPQAEFYGMDISEEMLKACPEGTDTKCATLLNAPYSDGFFDCVYCVEVLEHALLIENAIREMVRILKPGGKIVIIDKSIAKIGRLEIKSWERWFKIDEIKKMLKNCRVEAGHKVIAYSRHTQPDGLFVAWEGIKK